MPKKWVHYAVTKHLGTSNFALIMTSTSHSQSSIRADCQDAEANISQGKTAGLALELQQPLFPLALLQILILRVTSNTPMQSFCSWFQYLQAVTKR